MESLRRFVQDEKFGLYLMVFMTNLGWAITSPLLPEISSEFKVSAAQVALVSSAYGLTRLVLNLPIGLMLNRVDQRLLRVGGALILCLGSVLSALATSFYGLILGQLISGAGGAIVLVTNMVWISHLSTPERRGWDLGVYQAVFQASVSISPMLSGWLATWGDWRTAFWFAAVTPVLAFLPLFGARADWLERVRHAVAQEKQAKTMPAESAWRSSTVLALIVANWITFVMFFTSHGFQGTVFPLYGGIVLGLSTGAIGMVIGLSTIVRFVLSLVGGHLSDRFGRRVVLVPGLLLVGLGTALLSLASNVMLYWLVMLIFSLGRFGNNVPATVLADHAPASRWGFFMGLNRLMGDLGTVFGPLAMGLLVQNYGYTVTSFSTSLLVWGSAILVIVGVTEVRPRQPLMGWMRQRLRI
ncbi:MAG: MFS transporter [Anaerolineae bacterium]